MDTFDSINVQPTEPRPESSDGSYLISIDLLSPEAGAGSTTILYEPIIIKGPLTVETITDKKELDGYSAGKYYSNAANGITILHGETPDDKAEVSDGNGYYKTTTKTAKETMMALDKHVKESGGRRKRKTRRRKTKTSRRRKTRARRTVK